RLGLPAGMFAQGPVIAAQAQIAEPEVSAEHLLAPINGVISAWKVENGEQVTEGQVVAIMEAMKMEVQVLAHRSGVIQISAEKGATCHAETMIASIN
ncbi:acetyl-CoA carboxylase biotin carboxyl carrier protein subunit, partial [Acinetobacter baumannii]